MAKLGMYSRHLTEDDIEKIGESTGNIIAPKPVCLLQCILILTKYLYIIYKYTGLRGQNFVKLPKPSKIQSKISLKRMGVERGGFWWRNYT